jgi:uncharacterized protein (DUF952 family)
MTAVVYKIAMADEWAMAEEAGVFGGSTVDRRDGYIHFSTALQVVDTAWRHFRGADNVVLVAISTRDLPIRWEPARSGDLFPHLYAALPLSSVLWTKPLPLGPDGRHQFPPI